MKTHIKWTIFLGLFVLLIFFLNWGGEEVSKHTPPPPPVSKIDQCKDDCRICEWNCHIDYVCVDKCMKY